jgi:hypothetical protein
VQFVALGYHCFLTKKIEEVHVRRGKNESGKTKVLVGLEKQLDKWIKQHSLAQILDWFDCIETTNAQTVMGNRISSQVPVVPGVPGGSRQIVCTLSDFQELLNGPATAGLELPRYLVYPAHSC